mmetsp:Transcript_108133/g.247984  ORF Transcript_108133/g.247984 Transcript_108133/m.247984 type:complete len:203 (-) Transcript_108133:966-1574(-)
MSCQMWDPPSTSMEARKMATSVGDPISFHVSVHSFAAMEDLECNRCMPACALLVDPSTLAPLFRRPQVSSSEEVGGASDWSCMRSSMVYLVPSGRTTSVAVISPEVRVPVLSLQMILTQPKVSIASNLRINTFLFSICCEAMRREMVTVGSNPSGTWANNAEAAFSKICCGCRGIGEDKFAHKDNNPTATATPAMVCTKCSI